MLGRLSCLPDREVAVVTRVLHTTKRCVAWLLRMVGYVVGVAPVRPQDPHYHQLQELCDRGHITMDDIEHIVVPLLIARGEQVQGMAHTLRRSIIENRVLYVALFAALAILAALADGLHSAQLAQDRTQDRLETIAKSNRALATSNRMGIRVNCTLLVNVAIEQGIDGDSGQNLPPRAKLRLLYRQRTRQLLTPAQRRQEAQIMAAIKRQGRLALPDCDEVANHPERVRPLARVDGAVSKTRPPTHP